MDSIFIYLVELNLSFLILYGAYRLFFEKDRNFLARRIYLLGILFLTLLLPLIPDTVRHAVNQVTPIGFNLEELTIYAYAPAQPVRGSLSPWKILMILYFVMLGLGLVRLSLQCLGIFRAIKRSDRLQVQGRPVLANPHYHASSFFGYIFIDPKSLNDENIGHILEHEQIHRNEWHSVDRVLVELFTMFSWFNPAAWIYRSSVIENLEFLADSSVIQNGANPAKYQLSILNQYIGSASVTNSFNSQIKNRIKMLNKNYKPGSNWKLTLIFPMVFITVFALSCSERQSRSDLDISGPENRIYMVVDEAPTFNGEDPVMPFRKYIAQNVVYPDLAKERGIEGKIFVKFVVRKNGTLEIPSKEEIAALEGVPLDEVVVVGYKPIDPDAPSLDENDIDLLKKEAIRVVLSSPRWEPGKAGGKAVDVLYIFPINFVLQ